MRKMIVLALLGWASTHAWAEAPAAATKAASAPSSCEAKAVSKEGKPLAGAAKATFLKKCEAGATPTDSGCEAKAVSKEGKPLAGAAKATFMKKCEADAKAK